MGTPAGSVKSLRMSIRLTSEEGQRLERLARFLGTDKSSALLEALRMMDDTVQATMKLAAQPGVGTKLTALIQGMLTRPEEQVELPGIFLRALRDLDAQAFARRMGAYLALFVAVGGSGKEGESGQTEMSAPEGGAGPSEMANR